MKKLFVLLSALLVLAMIFQAKPVYAASSGWERQKEPGEFEVYFEYLPIVPYDPEYPTASEEFALTYYVWQYDWWGGLDHCVPCSFSIEAHYRDDTCGSSNYVDWKRWIPASISQDRWHISWSLGGSFGPLDLGVTVDAPTGSEIYTDYTEYATTGPDGRQYLRLTQYISAWNVGYWYYSTYSYGGGSLNVPNDQASPHQGHHSLVWLSVTMYWIWIIGARWENRSVNFILGDDNPAATDCWLTVEQGNTEYDEFPPGGGGGGGCPYALAWNGGSYVLDNNILPTSERSNGTDVEDYYKLEQALLPRDGQYSLLISEFEHEHSYIDQVRLLAVDHDSDVRVAVDPNGQILTYKNPTAPASAIDNYGNSRLNEIRFMDGDISDPATFFYGNASDYLVLNFGRVSSDNAKLILRDDYKSEEVCIDVQVLNRYGQWQTVTTVTPRNYWTIEGVDLSRYVVKNRDFKVRLLWTSPHRLDYAGLDTTRQASYQVTYATLISATHSTQGDVITLLTANDNAYAELIPGQQIQIDFTLPDNQRQARTYILYTEGHYITIP